MGEAALIEIELIRLKDVVDIIKGTLTFEEQESSNADQDSYPSGWGEALIIDGLSSDE